MDTNQAKPQTTTPSASGANKEATQDKTTPNVDKPGVETKSAASDPQRQDEFHSLTNGLTVRKVDSGEVVFVQVLGTADITPMTKDQFESSYGKVSKNVTVREAGTNKFFEGHELEGGKFLVHGPVGVREFKDKETLEKEFTLNN